VTAIFEAQKLHEWVERALDTEKLYWKTRGELEDWMERCYEAERQLGQARDKVAQMEESLSWRVTRPLRALMARVRGGRAGT
jgi:hypothetical protein